MTHEEVRSLLPGYAAAELGVAESDAVRAHLATGCIECLRDVFSLPVGSPPVDEAATPAAETPSPAPADAILPVHPEQPADMPRPVHAVVPPPLPLETTPGAVRTPQVPRWSRVRGLAAAAVLLGLLAAGLAVWMVGDDLRAREATARTEAARLAARLAETDAQRAALETRVEQLERELHAAQAEASRQVEAVQETAELSAQLSHDLEAAQERIGMLGRGLRRRDREIDRLLTGVDERLSLGELLATPGVELMQLRAVAPFHDVHGHVIWHPARTALLLYAFDLPPPPAGGGYRVRLALDDGRLEAGPAFTPGPRGDAALPVRLSTDATHLRAVEVLLDPAAEPVLAGRKGTPAG